MFLHTNVWVFKLIIEAAAFCYIHMPELIIERFASSWSSVVRQECYQIQAGEEAHRWVHVWVKHTSYGYGIAWYAQWKEWSKNQSADENITDPCKNSQITRYPFGLGYVRFDLNKLSNKVNYYPQISRSTHPTTSTTILQMINSASQTLLLNAQDILFWCNGKLECSDLLEAMEAQ